MKKKASITISIAAWTCCGLALAACGPSNSDIALPQPTTTSTATPQPSAPPSADPIGSVIDGRISVPPALPASIDLPLAVPDSLAASGVQAGRIERSEQSVPPGPETPTPEPETCDLWIRVPADVIRFEHNSAVINAAGLGYLERLAMELNEARELQVTGHASADGPAEHNMSLSERRASAVANALIDHLPPSVTVVASGAGETTPIEGLDPTDARNRRVEFTAEVPNEQCETWED